MKSQHGRAPTNQPLVSSKQSYTLNPPPTNPSPVTISTGDSDLSWNKDVKHIKCNYCLKFTCTAEEIPKLSYRNCVSKQVVIKVSNLAGIVNLLRELDCHQIRVRHFVSPSVHILKKLDYLQTPPPPGQVGLNAINTDGIRLSHLFETSLSYCCNRLTFQALDAIVTWFELCS